jgi:hypothetical protein
MADAPEPTELDKQNAATRDAIAARQLAEYRQVMAWADRIMGHGWYPSHKHFLAEKDEEELRRREGGAVQAVVTVYTVTNGVRERHFVLRDGQPAEVASMTEGFGPMLLEPHPTRGFVQRGQWRRIHRFSLCWAPFDLYEPRSAEQLAALRQTRERKREELADTAFAAENPLLAQAGIRRKDLDPEEGRGR